MEGLAVVVGTGATAPGLARACAAAGLRTRLVGRSPERAREAAAAAGVEAGALEAASFRDAALAIESVVEDEAVKLELLPQVEAWLPGDALLATNTSSLSIGALTAGLERPERFAGLHFMYPADLSPGCEVVAGPRTAPETLERAAALVRAMGKTPLLCRKDVPGFIWNRLQHALLREALWLLENGVADVETIDAALADGLAPRWLGGGPFATADLGGINTWRRVYEILEPRLSVEANLAPLAARDDRGETFYEWTPELRERVAGLRRRFLERAREDAAARRDATPPPL